MNWIKYPIKIAIFLSLFVGLQQLIELKTKGFCLQKIGATDLPPHSAWDVAPPSAQEILHIDQALSQSYTLLGSGSECFAFLSADGKTVIKFFKLDHARPVYLNKGLLREDHSSYAGTLSNHPLLHTHFPEPLNIWKNRLFGIREFRLTRTFSSLKMAYEELKDETGIFYLHLNPTTHLNNTLTLIDGNGIHHSIALDSTPFLLQHYAVPLEPHFETLLLKQEIGKAKESIDSLLDLIEVRCRKGFADRDFINRNIGYIGTKAIEIDMGSFNRDPEMKHPLAIKRELFFVTLELREWLKIHSPELLNYCEEQLNAWIRDDVNL